MDNIYVDVRITILQSVKMLECRNLFFIFFFKTDKDVYVKLCNIEFIFSVMSY